MKPRQTKKKIISNTNFDKTKSILSDKTNLNSTMAWSNRLRGKKPIDFHESTLSTENEDSQLENNLKLKKDTSESEKKKIPIYLRQTNLKENSPPLEDSNIYKFVVDTNEQILNKKGKGIKRKLNKEDEELENIEKRFYKNQNKILKEVKKVNLKNTKKNILSSNENTQTAIQPKKKVKDKITQEKNKQIVLPLREPNGINAQQVNKPIPVKETKKAMITATPKPVKNQNYQENINSLLIEQTPSFSKNCVDENKKHSFNNNNPLVRKSLNMSLSQKPSFIAPSPVHSFSTSVNNFPTTPKHIPDTPNFGDITPIKGPQNQAYSTPAKYPGTSTPFYSTNFSKFIPQFSQNNSFNSPAHTPSIHSYRSLSRLLDSRESSLKRSSTIISNDQSKHFGFDYEDTSEELPKDLNISKNENDIEELKKRLASKMVPLIQPIPQQVVDENKYDNDIEYEELYLETLNMVNKPKLKQKKIDEMNTNSHYDSNTSSSFSYIQNHSFNENSILFDQNPPHTHFQPPRKSFEREKRKVRFYGGELETVEDEDFDEGEETEATIENESIDESFIKRKPRTKKKSKQDKMNDKLIKEINKNFSEVDDFELIIE